MSTAEKTVTTSHGDIAYCESSGRDLPVVLIHGNSMSKDVFRDVLAGALGEKHRLIALDLPGHGRSADALDPMRTYTMPGYAKAVVEALGAMDVRQAAVYGWSLGGHIALEMMPIWSGMVGVMISGTPPVGRGAEAVQAGFRPIPQAGLAGKREMSAEEVEVFAMATCGSGASEIVRQAIRRTDGRAREIMLTALFTGQTSDQKAIVEKSMIPVAVVNGAHDPLVNLDYVGAVNYRDLWDKHCYVLRGAGHAPFFDKPDVFMPILDRFVAEMSVRAARRGAANGAKSAVA